MDWMDGWIMDDGCLWMSVGEVLLGVMGLLPFGIRGGQSIYSNESTHKGDSMGSIANQAGDQENELAAHDSAL